ncbi:thymidylate synthase [Kutzneria sp. CA-103260]|uniref:thymidylate synthase n=1 Tax=Kutzneria sp. CA-103260 TaxID=2802641 RepID=UPI001BA85188|nr:thymidylate synthase [Kutzneria sp. CA-103260]QUQ65336.1 Thymidylate synthase [Kutzneria sp. CA-103260]
MPTAAHYSSFAEAYTWGLESLRTHGQSVPSVCNPYSKASNFGRADRPWTELIAVSLSVSDPLSCLAYSPHLPVHVPYCYGLLAWSLDGRDDVDTLAYYRGGAHEFSDDHRTLSGAFGHRLYGDRAEGDQLRAIVGRIRRDPAHRRSYASIISSADNFVESREYPCAAGVQLFLRDNRLTWLTVMRAQQALTVLPYDMFLFMQLHQVTASQLGVPCGPHLHQSGTFHIYENEHELADRVIADGVSPVRLPAWPSDLDAVDAAVNELVETERNLRESAVAGDIAAIDKVAATSSESEFVDVARAVLATFAYRRCADGTTVVSPFASPELASIADAKR